MSWHFIEKALLEFVRAARICQNARHPGQVRQREYNLRLSILQVLVSLLLEKSLEDFSTFYINSQTFTTKPERRRGQQDRSAPAWEILGFGSAKKSFQQDRLLCLLEYMMKGYRNVPKVLLELDKVLGKKKQAKRLTLKVWQLISEIGVLWRLVESCRYQQPAVAPPSLENSFFFRQLTL